MEHKTIQNLKCKFPFGKKVRQYRIQLNPMQVYPDVSPLCLMEFASWKVRIGLQPHTYVHAKFSVLFLWKSANNSPRNMKRMLPIKWCADVSQIGGPSMPKRNGAATSTCGQMLCFTPQRGQINMEAAVESFAKCHPDFFPKMIRFGGSLKGLHLDCRDGIHRSVPKTAGVELVI